MSLGITPGELGVDGSREAMIESIKAILE